MHAPCTSQTSLVFGTERAQRAAFELQIPSPPQSTSQLRRPSQHSNCPGTIRATLPLCDDISHMRVKPSPTASLHSYSRGEWSYRILRKRWFPAEIRCYTSRIPFLHSRSPHSISFALHVATHPSPTFADVCVVVAQIAVGNVGQFVSLARVREQCSGRARGERTRAERSSN